MHYCLVILCIGFRFFVTFQFAPQLALFLLNHTVSLLILLFMASYITAKLSCLSDLDFLSLLNLLFGFFYLISQRFFISLTCLCISSYVLSDLHNGTELTGCVFLIYTLYPAFNSTVNPLLQSSICVNCYSPTPLLKKHQAGFLLSFSFSGTESLYPARWQTTYSGFTPINSVLHSSRIESPSSIVCHKKAGNKRKTAAKEIGKDKTYNLPGYVLFH